MNTSPKCTQKETLEVAIDKRTANVRIPRMISEGQYRSTMDQLLKLHREHNPTAWILDLSEQDGLTITLVGLLLGFRNHARNQGCEVRFTGIRITPAVSGGQQEMAAVL